MTKNQSWKTCKYSVAADEAIMGHELKQYGLSELYGCENASVLGLGYPIQHIRDGSESIEVAKLHGILIGDELSTEQASRLKSRAEAATMACRHCRYYEKELA